ncbi:MAG: tetraacyldisaccharide 4'-kinase [Rickettsiales bacterium]|jgi:tetraacyldisaccharide 4'-kinase|nr:tetraacyldisaccharide 4'-kinase [Rickettsiales bacterium]
MKTPGWFLKRSFMAYLLLPLSVIYFFISRLVYFIRLRNQTVSRVPVICIGNIFAGGVGKTPIVREVAKRFCAPVVMRGYGAKRQSREYRVESRDNVEFIGDEARMLSNVGLKVFTGNRKKNIESINNSLLSTLYSAIAPRAIVMDDGFQNPTIKKDISVLVFDEKLGLGNGFVLPAGPLREPVSAMRRADAVVIIKGKGQKAKGKIERIAKKYNKPVFYAKNETKLPSALCLLPFVAFAGIGYPRKFFDALPQKNLARAIPFPDHYQYNSADLDLLFEIAKSENARLLTTEKDWVRLPPAAQKKIAVAKLETVIDQKFFNWLEGKLNEKRN